MERFVRIVAPTNTIDFLFKLAFFILVSGVLNHIRSVVTHGLGDAGTYLDNLEAAAFTALPMVTMALLLIQHLNKLQKRLYHQATTDQLTNLPNRRWFIDQCPDVLTSGHTLVLIDLDAFKAVNDTFGHVVGDQCLIAMADHFRSILPADIQCARIGGEEFGILFHNVALDDIQSISTKICHGANVIRAGLETITVTASAGIAPVDRDVPIRHAFQLADSALYDAKAAGKAQSAMATCQKLQALRAKRSLVRAAVA